MLSVLAIRGYRSLRDVRLPLAPLTIITGANGSGKSSVYRALRLMTDIAHGRVVGALAAEGGLQRTLWAGPEQVSAAMQRGEVPVEGTARRRGPVSLQMGFGGDAYGYAIDIGLPKPSGSLFARDPQIKTETLWTGEVAGRHNIFADRHGPLVRVRDRDGEWQVANASLDVWDSMMTHAADPREASELLLVREQMRDWRFYDHLDTGRDAPARRTQVGTRTPVLASDGADLAAAVATLREQGNGEAFDRAVADAFDGAQVRVEEHLGYFDLLMEQPGLLRPLTMAEVSDGTLRYLLLAAALCSPRPPALMILNEPETSLHADLLPPLGRLMTHAANQTQLLVVSHAAPLVTALTRAQDSGGAAHHSPMQVLELVKTLGETRASGIEEPRWHWPTR